MSMIATLLLCGVLLGILAITPKANILQTSGPHGRPYSFYYPYDYKYYTPHKFGSFQGYVVYTNGAYVYMNN